MVGDDAVCVLQQRVLIKGVKVNEPEDVARSRFDLYHISLDAKGRIVKYVGRLVDSLFTNDVTRLPIEEPERQREHQYHN